MERFYAFVTAFIAVVISVSASEFPGRGQADPCVWASPVEGAASVAGAYTWLYVSMIHSGADASRAVDAAIVATDAAGAVDVAFGDFVVEGVFDSSAGSLSLASGQYLGYNAQSRMDVFFYHGVRDGGVPDAPVRFDGSPAVFVRDGHRFVLPPEDVIAVGNAASGYLIFGERNVLERDGGAGLAPPAGSGGEETPDGGGFTLGGVRVDAPTSAGVYIRRTGAETTKIFVR